MAAKATVRRDGVSLAIPIDQLVPGDIVMLVAGYLVPEDSRLLESRTVSSTRLGATGRFARPSDGQVSPIGAVSESLIIFIPSGDLLDGLGSGHLSGTRLGQLVGSVGLIPTRMSFDS